MVAKAATKAGEFFCFHCGKQVQSQENTCKSCGSAFDKVTEAFRCPRCSNLLPVGAAACPACGLGFKVRTISSGSKISEDDKFLMKLIDWGKQGEAPPPKPQVTRSVKASSPPPPPPPPPSITRKISSEPSKIAPSFKAQVRATMPVKEAPKGIPPEAPRQVPKPSPIEPAKGSKKEIPKEEAKPSIISKEKAAPVGVPGKLEGAEADLHQVTTRNMNRPETIREENESDERGASIDTKALYDRPQADFEDTTRSESESHQLREATETRNATPSTIPTPIVSVGGQEDHGLSNQALKKLLEEREREVGDLKDREEELARKEEHLNRKIRAYAVKKKELETLEKQLEDNKSPAATGAVGESEGQDFPTELVVDDKQQWLKEQSRIKNGLIEIRNEIAPKKGGIGYAQPQVSSDVVEKIEILEEKLADISKERDDLAAHIWKLEESRNDVIELLKVLDQLLGKLTPEMIDEFSKSKDFKLYEKVLDDLNI
jgi:prefoldin subunit 5